MLAQARDRRHTAPVARLKKRVFKLKQKKLKETVDKMLKNYQVKISNLEMENKELSENFDKAYKIQKKK